MNRSFNGHVCMFFIWCISILGGQNAHAEKPTTNSVKHLLRARVTAERASVLAGAGVAFVERARVFRGDMIVVLSKHATDWLHVRVGQIDGYIPLKFVQIIKRSSVTPDNLNRERKLNVYEYDDQGRRLKPNGERAGRGNASETHGEATTTSEKLSDRFSVSLSIGPLQNETQFESNAEPASLLRYAKANPIHVATRLDLRFRWSPLITLQLDAMDYRGGKTELQTALLNGGAPFFLANDGQTIRAVGILEHHFQGWLIGAGPIVSFINHRFQRSDPSILFLSSNLWTLGGSLKLALQTRDFQLRVESHLSIPLTLKQEPVTSGTLKGGHSLGASTQLLIPIGKHYRISLLGLLSRDRSSFEGLNDHVDSVSMPGTDLSYTSARYTVMLYTFLLGLERHF